MAENLKCHTVSKVVNTVLVLLSSIAQWTPGRNRVIWMFLIVQGTLKTVTIKNGTVFKQNLLNAEKLT